jgi:hypothetical protein
MKIVVAGISGNLGKSTLAAHMLVPRMNNAKLIIVESINQDTKDLVGDSEKIRGEEFRRIYVELVLNNDLVVDVGASNAEAFFEGLSSFNQGYDEVDLFVIPTVPGAKEQAESILTARMLAAMGVEKNKIKIVFNRVKRSVEDEFPDIFNAATAFDCFVANPECMVFENDIYADLADLKLPLSEACILAANSLEKLKGDLKKFARDSDKYSLLVKKVCMAKKAIITFEQLDNAFQALFCEVADAEL